MCKIRGCDRESQYKAQDVCQKHYFRFMRTGSYEKSKPKYRKSNPKGYQTIYKPSHPLSHKDGYVYEHRFVVYEEIGENLSSCEICEKPVTWKTVHIDHIDNDVTNNERRNLRPLCRVCNVGRSDRPQHTYHGRGAITWSGETKTPNEWGKDDRIPVRGHTIRQRLKRGLSVEDALFMPLKKHKPHKWNRLELEDMIAELKQRVKEQEARF